MSPTDPRLRTFDRGNRAWAETRTAHALSAAQSPKDLTMTRASLDTNTASADVVIIGGDEPAVHQAPAQWAVDHLIHVVQSAGAAAQRVEPGDDAPDPLLPRRTTSLLLEEPTPAMRSPFHVYRHS